jgi:hypothetical protein
LGASSDLNGAAGGSETLLMQGKQTLDGDLRQPNSVFAIGRYFQLDSRTRRQGGVGSGRDSDADHGDLTRERPEWTEATTANFAAGGHDDKARQWAGGLWGRTGPGN